MWTQRTKLLGSLVFITILAHLLIWPILDFSEGKIWIYANTRLPLYKLFNPSVDGVPTLNIFNIFC